jgi:hypothetical protein
LSQFAHGYRMKTQNWSALRERKLVFRAEAVVYSGENMLRVEAEAKGLAKSVGFISATGTISKTEPALYHSISDVCAAASILCRYCPANCKIKIWARVEDEDEWFLGGIM